jgi:hypothetical protein
MVPKLVHVDLNGLKLALHMLPEALIGADGEHTAFE